LEEQMITKLKRYLGNTDPSSFEVHDTENEKPNCQLDEILAPHRRWYATLSEAERDYAYDTCQWCLGDSTR